jgi:benzoylformate decarboxylase
MALVGDGSAAYTPQALWTAAREGLQIKVVILNNGGYGILKSFNERFFSYLGHSLGLDVPGLDLATLARSMGVEAARVSEPESLDAELERAFASEGPYLLDVRLDTVTPEVF